MSDAPVIKTAMLLAAGLGTRMQPLTADRPKSMLQVAGKPMLDWALDKCVAAGVERVVINLHYKGDVIEEYVRRRADVEIVFSREETLLESGGGVKFALPLLGTEPFFCINTDLVWTDECEPALTKLAAAWESKRMDLMMLMKETDKAVGFEPGRGDYFMMLGCCGTGKVYGRTATPPRPYVFTGTMIVNPRVYDDITDTIFSNRNVFDAAEKAGRLFGLVHTGGVYHAGTPADLAEVNRLLQHPA